MTRRFPITHNGLRLRQALVGLCFAALLLASGVAQAQSEEDRASKHFEQGVELYQDGNLGAALVEFERAYDLVPNYRLLYNLAQVQMERGESVLALNLFERYLDDGGDEVASDRRVSVEKELRRLRKRVAQLSVTTNVDGAELFVDDLSKGHLPLKKPVLINSGVSVIRVEKPGYLTQTHRISAAGGEAPQLTLDLTPVPTATSTAGDRDAQLPQRATDDRAGRAETVMEPDYTAFWVSTAVAGLLGGTAATFGILAFDADKDLDGEFNTFPTDSDRIETAQDKVRTYATTADGAGLGAVVAAGVALYFLANPTMVPEDESESGDASFRIVAQPNGLSFAGTF